MELRAPSANAVFTNVPHYYEFNSLENPNGYYWCGHASLKGVGMKHGTYRTLGQIHSAFCSGSSAYCSDSHCGGNRYCAKLQDLHWMAINQNGNPLNYNFTTSTVESIGSLTNFYQKIVNGVTYHKPYIVPSNYYYGTVGHFYAVVGYDTKYILPGVIDYNLSNVYLRDVADPIPNNTNWDLEVSANVFYTNRVGTQMLIVRPGSYI